MKQSQVKSLNLKLKKLQEKTAKLLKEITDFQIAFKKATELK